MLTMIRFGKWWLILISILLLTPDQAQCADTLRLRKFPGFFQGLSRSRRPLTHLLLRVEAIRISGNTKTRPEAILSLFDFRTGDVINKRRLDRNIRRLQDSNFFKRVEVYTQPGQTRGNVVVHVEVTERHWPYFQFKGGFNELDGWYLSPIGLRFDNTFGRGNYMGIEFYIGDRLTGINFDYLRPNIFDSDLNLGLLLLIRSRQFVHYLESERYLQRVDEGAWMMRLNGNHGIMKYLWFDLGLGSVTTAEQLKKADDRDSKLSLPPSLLPYQGRKPHARFVISLNLDTRNQIFYPDRGWWGSLALAQVITEMDERFTYHKWVLDLRGYRELTHKWVIALRGKAGWIDEKAPFYDKFYLGGPNSLRGYEDRSLNPPGYGSRLLQGSAELRFPISSRNYPRHFLSGVLFYDMGEAWSKPDQFEPDRLKSGIGYGFRFKLPFIGLLRLDFAYPVPEYDLRFHLSLGHMF